MIMQRILGDNGPVHIGVPENWNGDIQIFLHGWDLSGRKNKKRWPWYVDEVMETFPVRDAWEPSSDCVLLVPQTREGRKFKVRWSSLAELLTYASGATGQNLNNGSIHIISHSGGYVNTLQWLGDKRIHRISLLDSLYSGVDKFLKWVNFDESHSLDLACSRRSKPHKNAGKILQHMDHYHVTQVFGTLPDCRVNYVPMSTSHMSWVTDVSKLAEFFR